MPKLSSVKINKVFVDGLDTDRDATYRDAGLKGFAVRTKPSGTKTYLVIYKNKDGRTRSLALGQHGAITADEARKKALIELAKVSNKEDPSEARQQERAASTVKELCVQYLEAAESGKIRGKKGLPKKASTLSVDRGRIERHILPLIGNKKVRDLTTKSINDFMDDIQDGKTAVDVKTKARGRAVVEGGAGTASRTVGLLGGILSYAVRKGIIGHNPCRGVLRPADNKREVRLEADQYKMLGAALRAAEAEGEAWQSVAAFRLLALTGCRIGEIENLKWSDVDLPGQALRLSDSKTGKSIRPLGGAAVAILEALPRSKGYVFPALRIENAPYGSLPKAWGRIKSRIKDKDDEVLKGLTPHGLRHAFASVAGDLGFTEITIASL